MMKLRTTTGILGLVAALTLAPTGSSASAEAPAAEAAKARTTVTIGQVTTQRVSGRVSSPRAACKKQRVVRLSTQFSTTRGRTNANGFYSLDTFLIPGERVTVVAPATPRCKADSASRR